MTLQLGSIVVISRMALWLTILQLSLRSVTNGWSKIFGSEVSILFIFCSGLVTPGGLLGFFLDLPFDIVQSEKSVKFEQDEYAERVIWTK